MNYKMVRYILGIILFFEAIFMAPSLIVAVIYREQAGLAILLSMLLCAVAGGLLRWKEPENKTVHAREGLVVAGLAWILLSIFGAFPFVISGVIPSYINALFETASGFTTTGASILTDVEAVPHCIQFWRSFTHWVGGMGVLVLVMAVLPLAGGSNMYLMKAESPGPSVGKFVPRVRGSAMILYRIYLVISLAMLVFLLLGRMPLFDSFITVFGTAGTGGFGIRNDSIGGYSSYIQVVTTVFMLLFGINFNAYYLLTKGKWKSIFKITEIRVYLVVVLAAILLITLNISGMYGGVFKSLRYSSFQVASIMTTTGFATADFNLWPAFSKTILVCLMFIGACAGSTGGGIKVQRIVILFKSIGKELDTTVHPHNVRKLKVDGQVVEHSVVRAVNVFIASYLFVFACSMLIVSLDNFDFTTNFTAVAATMNNIGPGLEMVGATGNYSAFSNLSKLVLIFDMIAGRLELFPLLILFKRSTWTK